MDDLDREKMQDFARRWTAAQPVVAAFVCSLVARHHDAEDLLQRTAAALVARHDDYDPARPFAAWAIGVARIEVLRELGAARRERSLVVFDTSTVEAVASAFEGRSEEMSMLRAALDGCIGRLGGKVAEIFRLHHLEGMAPAEIARQVKRTPNAILVTLHRGRAAVRECARRQLATQGVYL